jgi:hypothetical protein
MTPTPDSELLRHALATIAYRAAKTLRGSDETFASFTAQAGVRTPGQLLAHMGDLLDWIVSILGNAERWREATPRPWQQEQERFFAGLTACDQALAGGVSTERARSLLQGPIADALTHVGQLALLRRLAGAPIRGENYAKAKIEVGRVGADQVTPGREFG